MSVGSRGKGRGRAWFLSAKREGKESGQKTANMYSLGHGTAPQEAEKREEDGTLEKLSMLVRASSLWGPTPKARW